MSQSYVKKGPGPGIIGQEREANLKAKASVAPNATSNDHPISSNSKDWTGPEIKGRDKEARANTLGSDVPTTHGEGQQPHSTMTIWDTLAMMNRKLWAFGPLNPGDTPQRINQEQRFQANSNALGALGNNNQFDRANTASNAWGNPGNKNPGDWAGSISNTWVAPGMTQRERWAHPNLNAWAAPEIAEREIWTHPNSRTWVAPQISERERWLVVEANLLRMNLINKSPFVPHNYAEWLEFRAASVDAAAKEEARKCALKQVEYAPGTTRIDVPFEKRNIRDNRGAVLSQQTIWSPWYQPTQIHPQALWPTREEMKEEGDERNTSGYGRFPALPRIPGNETVAWKQKHLITPYPMDRVWDVPDILEGEAPPNDAHMENLLGDLLNHIDGKDGKTEVKTAETAENGLETEDKESKGKGKEKAT